MGSPLFHPPRRRRGPSPALLLAERLGAVLVCVVVLSSGVLSCGGRAGDDAAIRALIDREAAAISGEDLKALSEIWAQDDEILLFDVPPPGRFQGWTRISRVWKEFFDRFSDIRLTIETVKVEVSGDIGYATYDWKLGGRMGDLAVDDQGLATAIYRRRDGPWRLVHAHYSPAFPAPAAAPAPSSAPPAGSPGRSR